ncbi:MAG: hypothetical protein PHF18_05930 [Methanosarcina sp.]|uniref:hypothetical protein n=1 Tax=Methanosarcina sp. TaxID=2213 RepID=UPI002611F253|nr:hypothetical protein [Methanosarcina sp.]MDD3246377.1 hypothetical protein [Methanosarcina sp.]MDD4247843.1 hypothetical protein [Methanosarcina sp.]
MEKLLRIDKQKKKEKEEKEEHTLKGQLSRRSAFREIYFGKVCFQESFQESFQERDPQISVPVSKMVFFLKEVKDYRQ